jgi:hypothetical protein
MKTSSKRSFLMAAIAVISTGISLADDPQLQNRIGLERVQNTSANRTTVAVYANDRGVGWVNSRATNAETRFELRSNAHGQTSGAFVPANK